MASLERSVSPNSRSAPNDSRAAFEIFQERLADAVALPAVVDRQAEFDLDCRRRMHNGPRRRCLMTVDQHGRDHGETVGFADMDEISSSDAGNSLAAPRKRL